MSLQVATKNLIIQKMKMKVERPKMIMKKILSMMADKKRRMHEKNFKRKRATLVVVMMQLFLVLKHLMPKIKNMTMNLRMMMILMIPYLRALKKMEFGVLTKRLMNTILKIGLVCHIPSIIVCFSIRGKESAGCMIFIKIRWVEFWEMIWV